MKTKTVVEIENGYMVRLPDHIIRYLGNPKKIKCLKCTASRTFELIKGEVILSTSS